MVKVKLNAITYYHKVISKVNDELKNKFDQVFTAEMVVSHPTKAAFERKQTMESSGSVFKCVQLNKLEETDDDSSDMGSQIYLPDDLEPQSATTRKLADHFNAEHEKSPRHLGHKHDTIDASNMDEHTEDGNSTKAVKPPVLSLRKTTAR